MPGGRGENRAARWLVAAVFVVGACGGRDAEERAGARLSLTETLSGGDTLGYTRALEPRTFDFPRDHGPHGDFRTEWWYVTGNLDAEDGRRFGFQFTIFRSALAPASPDLRSAWATNQAYMGHFTVTDVAAGTFRAFERFARGAAGLAGASGPVEDGSASSFRVWIDDWALDGAPGASAFPVRLRAAEGSVGLELTLDAGKPRVLQGDQGLSQKGPEPGNASFYYAHTRMPASGTVTIDGEAVPVTGLAWMDREWSTSVLSGDQVGWDWFSLQLDDGWEVMVYQLRWSDGRADPLSDGVLIDPEGRKLPLEWGRDLTLEALGSWTSPIDGARYPSGWRLTVPERGVDLRITPLVADQELDLSFRYWEGAVEVRGTGVGGGAVEGRGYVELTGYAGLVPDR